MSKTLIITAHPSSKGFTHSIAQVIKEARIEEGFEVELIDLYKTDLKQNFFNFENIKEIPHDPIRDLIQKKISDANELIFVHPLWWIGPPAILKNFIDNNITSHFAYKFEDGKRVGMLTTKTARVYITYDSPFIIYILIGFPFVTAWVFGILMFCGIKVTGFTIIRNRSFKSDEERAKCLPHLKKNSMKQSIWLKALQFLADVIQ